MFYAVFCCVLFLGSIGWEKRIYQTVAKNVGAENKIAYLTFDDGPSEITANVLEALKKEEAKATFFLIGEQITEETVPLLQRMVVEGHEIGMHTYSHRPEIIYASAEAYISDVLKTAEKIKEATGITPRYFRFPWGSNNCYIKATRQEIVERLEKEGYIYFDWNVSGEDSLGKPSEAAIYRNVEKDAFKYKQPVILLHDSATNKNTANVLPDILQLFKEAGYRFETVDRRYQPYQYR